MLKTKDGYAKVIGTSYLGSSDYLLLSNGDSKAISSLSVNYADSAGNADTLDGTHLNGIFTAFGNDENNISATIGTVTKKFEVKYSNHSYYSKFIKGDDLRNANNAPNYYMNTFGDASLCTEFSLQGKLFGNGTYVNLITSTPWRDSGGGRPALLAIGNYIGLRSATNDSTWGAWRTIPTIDANGVMEIGKFIDWHWNNEIYGSQDFSTRLQALNTSSYPNTVYLPTQSGELALLNLVELSLYHVVDMRNYDSGYWHPVTVGLSRRGYNKIKVSVELDIGDKPSWATHDSGFTCNMEIWATAHGWGTTNAETICLNYTYGHCNSNPCGWKLLGYSSLGVLFLRGGSRYKVWTDFDATFTPHNKTYTWTSGNYTQSTGGPYTSCPGLDFAKNRIYANLDGTADNADKLDGYHASYSNNTPWGTIPVITTLGFMDIGKHLEFHYNNTTGSDYSTLLTCTGNYSNIVNLPSESGTLALLSLVVSTSDFTWANLSGKLIGNEFNIVNSGFSNSFWFNYLPIDNRNSSATISLYNMGNGNKGLASVYAYRFKADGKSCMWKDARNYAPFYSTFEGGFEPILDIKTVSGDWSIGSYDSYGNHLVFAYTSDSDFNVGRNGTALYYLTAGGEFKINTLRLAGSTNANMGVGSTNPQIIFAENSATLLVALTYTDWDTYRTSKGLKVHSYDGSDDANVWFEVLGYNYSSGYVKNDSSNAYVLLGGGGHKPLSEFLLGNGSYLPYNGWWSSGNGLDVNNSNGMIFAYASHKNSPFSSAWGIITTFDYTYNSDYKFLLAANCYSNAMYYRSRSNERGGWASWALVIDTGNIGSLTVDKSYHLRIDASGTWSTWYWQGLSGQPNWLWGSNDGGNMYVWNPSNFRVASATKLQTPRSIWGNSFDGTNNIGGTILPSATHTYNLGSATYMFEKTYTRYVDTDSGYDLRLACTGTEVLRLASADKSVNINYNANISGKTSIANGLKVYNGSNHGCYVEITEFIGNPTNGGSINVIDANGSAPNSRSLALQYGQGNVGIGTLTPSYKLDVNGLMRAGGFHHGSINSDNYILLAGGGYKSYGGSASNHIFLGYLNLYNGNNGTIDSYFYCLGYSVPFTYTRGGNYCKISIPNTTHQVFYIKAAIASVNYSGGGMDTWTGNNRGEGAWWLHCYASGNNDVRVKGFHNSNGDNDSWWGGNPLYSGSGSANVITVCLFGYVDFR